MNVDQLEIRQLKLLVQFKLPTNRLKMIQDEHSALSPVLTSAQLLHGRSASILPCPVHKSSFWSSKEVYETSHNAQSRCAQVLTAGV